MPNFDVVTIGGAVKDFTIYTNKGKIFNTPDTLTTQKMLAFEYGAKINASEVYCNLGGGAANAAVSLARLGLDTAIISRIGKDETGKDILAKFKTEKINTQLIQIDQKILSGFSFIISPDKKDKEYTAFLYRGANENLTFSSPRFKTKWLYVSSLSGSNWLKTLKEIFSFAEKNNIKIAWNPGNLQLQAGKKIISYFLKQTSILILNKDEAIELVLSGIRLGKKNPGYLNKPLYLLNILHDWGSKIVVITDGKKGAWAYENSKIRHIKAKKTRTADTTGVGDAFGSSFLAGFIKSKGNIKQSLDWGITNSASVIQKIGAQNGLLTSNEMIKKL